jgi:small subunit ribosomal protein S10e
MYRFLTDKGIEYLREYLNLPSEIVPATLKKTTRPLERVPQRPERPDRGPRREGFGREGYRGGERREGFGRGAPVDKAGAPGGFQPQFGGGYGAPQ